MLHVIRESLCANIYLGAPDDSKLQQIPSPSLDLEIAEISKLTALVFQIVHQLRSENVKILEKDLQLQKMDKEVAVAKKTVEGLRSEVAELTSSLMTVRNDLSRADQVNF